MEIPHPLGYSYWIILIRSALTWQSNCNFVAYDLLSNEPIRLFHFIAYFCVYAPINVGDIITISHYGPRVLPVVPIATIVVSFQMNGNIKEFVYTCDIF